MATQFSITNSPQSSLIHPKFSSHRNAAPTTNKLPAISLSGYSSSSHNCSHTRVPTSRLVLSKEIFGVVSDSKAPAIVSKSGKWKMMVGMSMSQKLTLGYAALVGLGGAMGYMKSGSMKSLASGGLSAAILYYVYTELPIRPTFAASLGLGVSAALLGAMGFRFKKTGKIFPAGVVALISLVMAGGYLHGILRAMH